jgi:hypothetical protein
MASSKACSGENYHDEKLQSGVCLKEDPKAYKRNTIGD